MSAWYDQTARSNKRGLSILAGIAAAGAAVMVMRRAIRQRRSISLADKAILITGGSRGLGLVLARRLAHAGARIAICARDVDALNGARAGLLKISDHEVVAIECDVKIPEQMIATVQTVANHFGGLDILINNAGLIQVGPIENQTIADYEAAMATHFWGPLHAIQTAIPVMKKQGGGRIVNIASIGGKIAVPHLLPYSASKFALVGLSEGMRAELILDNILVTTVCPGLVRTGSPRNAEFKGQVEKEYAWFATGDVLPIQSISADKLAIRIIDALQHGDAELITPLAASMPVKLHGIAPGFTARLMEIASWFLPSSDGMGNRTVKGKDAGGLEPKFAQIRNDAAAAQNNEPAS